MTTHHDYLDQLETELRAVDEGDLAASGLDRRSFVFLSLVSAAATTFGSAAATTLRAQQPGGRAQQPPPYPLGNGDSPALQFMPHPGGTGALMQKLMRERGAAAFERSTFTVERWRGAVPVSDEDLAFLPAHRISALLREKRVTSVRMTEIYLSRLKRLNPQLNCIVTLMEDSAMAEARQADDEIRRGNYRGPLHGVPYGLKDLFATKGVPTIWGSKDFETQVPDYDAEIVVRLREAGAVLLAKLATGLFAQGDQWYRGRTNNPWNLSQGASGSSTGPGSATPAGCVAFSIGTETQGSIVSPAIRNGLSALRPTFGRVSRHGGMVLAWSMDRVGPMCRTVEDCAMVFNVLHGVDEKDPSTVMTPFSFQRNVDLGRLRIGVDPNAPPEFIAKLRDLGMRPRDVGPRPTVAGVGNAIGVEGAAFFDAFVQQKAKELNIDLDALLAVPPAGGGGGGGGGGGAGGGVAGAGGGAPADPLRNSNWNPRFVNGRAPRAFDFVQSQRRRHVMIVQWGEYMKDLDMFIGSPTADIGANAQTGHPCVVVPYKFDVPAVQQGPGGPAAAAATPTPLAPQLNAQPICAVIVGALYNDDGILSVAHRFQAATDFHTKRPSL